MLKSLKICQAEMEDIDMIRQLKLAEMIEHNAENTQRSIRDGICVVAFCNDELGWLSLWRAFLWRYIRWNEFPREVRVSGSRNWCRN